MTPAIPDEAVQAALDKWFELPSTGDASSQKRDMRAALTAALPFLQGVKVRPMETAPNGERAEDPSVVEVHEGAWAVVKGTNGKNAGWIDTHELFAHQLYRHHVLSAIEVAPSPRARALEEHLTAIEKQLAVNVEYFHDDKRFLLETLQSHIVSHVAAIRALTSLPSMIYDDTQPLLADLLILSEDKHATDRQRRVATRALKALSSQPVADGGSRKFKLGERVTKIKGSSWTGRVVGFYSTELTPIGYAVESETEKGSVQTYPEAALRALPASPGASEQSDAEAIAENYLQEIQDGAWGDNGRTRGLARDRLKDLRGASE